LDFLNFVFSSIERPEDTELWKIQHKGANTFFFTAIKEWNSLSTDLKNINCENSFKVKLKQELIEVAKRKDDDVFERIV